MSHFVRHQASGVPAEIIIHQGAFVGAVVAGFVVLQSKMRCVVTQSEQEVVVAIVGCAEERAGFCHKIFEMIELFQRDFQCSGPVGGSIKVNLRVAFFQGKFFKIFSGQHRRIHQGNQRNRRKLHGIACLARALQSRAVFPPRGQLQACGEGDVTGLPALRI